MRPLLLLLVVLAGCVAPEPPPPVRRAAGPALPPLAGKLEQAPTADRKLKEPDAQAIVKVEGMKKEPKTAPPL